MADIAFEDEPTWSAILNDNTAGQESWISQLLDYLIAYQAHKRKPTLICAKWLNFSYNKFRSFELVLTLNMIFSPPSIVYVCTCCVSFGIPKS